MSDADNAALVIRCPTCKNLLPEPPGCSLFQCGGCGALLTAKTRNLMSQKEMVGAQDVPVKLNARGCSSSVAGTKGFVGDQEGIVRVFPSRGLPNFSEVSEGRDFESNCNTEIDGNGMSCFEGKEKMHKRRNDGVMAASSKKIEEGSSNFMYNYGRMSHVDAGMRNTYLEGSKRVEHLEQHRIELLRKLDELNNQLRHSGSLSRTTKEKCIVGQDLAHNEPYGIADAWMANDCLDRDMMKASKETCLNDKSLGRPLYYASYPDHYADRHEPYMQSSYHDPHMQDDTVKYGMRLESQMPRRPFSSMSSQYAHLPNFSFYYPGQYVDADPDTFKPYQPNSSSHHPTCSCSLCYNMHHNAIPSAQRSKFPDGTYAEMSSNPLVYHHNYDARATRGPSSFHGTSMRWTGDYNSRLGNYECQRTRRVVLGKGGRQCHPLLGGAPFLTCHNCFEVLQLPIKLLKLKDHHNKLRCGACSTVIYYFFQGNRLLISETSELMTESTEEMDEVILKSAGPVDKFNYDDFDTLSNDFKLIDEEHDLRDAFCNLNTNETYDTNLISTSTASPSNTVEECSQLYLEKNQRSSIAPPPGSPLQEHLDYSSSNHINQDEKGNLSRESDHDEVIPKAVVTTDQNSLKEVSMVTEMEVSFNGYSNSGASQDSGNGSKEEQPQQINRKDRFASIIKKSFKDIINLDQSNEGCETRVTINGHPISDRMVKKASRRAGRVQPGNYWYDVRAGFWGVMGGPCLGIIPPFIEEFNYPFPEDCSGGTTGVFVNGRELHEKDLGLLSGRGLPTTRDRSYIIEISGRVLDADSGKELDSLGRLARTVEKAKHGFGMKVPKETVVNKNEQ